ncbi:MAG: hypothetical protein GKR89_11595 [Candidatus Latescibacteria bacterium]|nr:hypothetical protein [Candidatus Latescibacterota bacterium]
MTKRPSFFALFILLLVPAVLPAQLFLGTWRIAEEEQSVQLLFDANKTFVMEALVSFPAPPLAQVTVAAARPDSLLSFGLGDHLEGQQVDEGVIARPLSEPVRSLTFAIEGAWLLDAGELVITPREQTLRHINESSPADFAQRIIAELSLSSASQTRLLDFLEAALVDENGLEGPARLSFSLEKDRLVLTNVDGGSPSVWDRFGAITAVRSLTWGQVKMRPNP